MEIYIEFITERMDPADGGPFTFFWIDDGVGVEGGFKNDKPIPFRSRILLNNEYQGLFDYKLIELEGDFHFRAHVEFDEEYVYPEFVAGKVMRHKILHNSTGFDEKVVAKRIKQLTAWVIDDFNYDQSIGVDQEDVHPTLKFVIAIFRMTTMNAWEWPGYIYEMTTDLAFSVDTSVL